MKAGVPSHVEKEKWRILPVGEEHDQRAACQGGHRRNAPWARVSASRSSSTSLARRNGRRRSSRAISGSNRAGLQCRGRQSSVWISRTDLLTGTGANARAALPCLGSFWRGLLKQDRRTARIRAVPPASSRPTSQATGEAGRIRRRADNGDEVAPPAGSRRFARRLTAALLVNGGYRRDPAG